MSDLIFAFSVLWLCLAGGAIHFALKGSRF